MTRLLRVTALVMRFIRQTRSTNRQRHEEAATVLIEDLSLYVECLDEEEIRNAELIWLRAIQRSSFSSEHKALSSGTTIRH